MQVSDTHAKWNNLMAKMKWFTVIGHKKNENKESELILENSVK